MVRRLVSGMMVAGCVVTGMATPAAADPNYAMCQASPAKVAGVSYSGPARSDSVKDGDVTFTVGVRPGESTLRAEGKGISFLKRLTADRVVVRIDVPGDWFELDASPAGAARLTRNGKSIKLHLTATGDDVAKAQKFAAGSKALAGLESLAATLESSTRPEAQSVLTSFALLHVVRGSLAPARSVAKTIQAQQAKNFTRAAWDVEEQPLHCWMQYAIEMNEALHVLDQCYQSYGWLPGMATVCGFEWVIKAELAWFWLIACSGGMPI